MREKSELEKIFLHIYCGRGRFAVVDDFNTIIRAVPLKAEPHFQGESRTREEAATMIGAVAGDAVDTVTR